LIPTAGVIFRQTPSTYNHEWHNAPARQFIVNLGKNCDGLVCFNMLLLELLDTIIEAFLLDQANLINFFSSQPASPTAPNFIIAIINHVHMHFDAEKAGYYFTAQQTSVTALKQW